MKCLGIEKNKCRIKGLSIELHCIPFYNKKEPSKLVDGFLDVFSRMRQKMDVPALKNCRVYHGKSRHAANWSKKSQTTP